MLKGTARQVHTADDLLKQATLLKDPAPGTDFESTRYITELMEHSNRQQMNKSPRKATWRGVLMT